jgi:hypothetical protein
LKLQSELFARTRSHVWHMKVLLYAVFNVRDRDCRLAAFASKSIETRREPGGHSLKAEQCSPLISRAFRPIASLLGRSWSLDHFASSRLALGRKFARYLMGDPRIRGPRNRC